ncbi:MAG: hypothetical protein RLZZ408_1560 [Verrucomicrobiota bacterium]
MKAAEEHLLIFERHFSPEKRCRPPSRRGIMPSACFSAPLPRGLVEGASAGRYPQRSRPSEQRHNNERREPRRSLRSSPEDEGLGRGRGKNRQLASAHGAAEIQAKGHKAFGFVAWHGGQLCWLGALLARPLLRIRYGSPLRGCSRQAALPAANSSRNGLYAI